jgi:hypothetical protein
MSTRQLARLGLSLMGVYLVVRSLVFAVGTFASQSLVIRETDAPFADHHINSILFSGSISIAAVVVFGIVPGALLIAKSQRWAESWFPDERSETEFSITVFFPIGLLLLGLDFGISGLSGLVGGIAQIMSSNAWSISHGWRTLGESTVSLVAGVALFIAGRRFARPDA